MTIAYEELVSLFFALLKFHSAQASAGKAYELPSDLPETLVDKLNTYAGQNDVAPAIFLAAITDLLFIREPEARNLQADTSSEQSSADIFGTYLEGILGRSALEHVLNLVRTKPRSISELVSELNFTPEEIVSATAMAQQLGMVTLRKTNEQTIVHLVESAG